MALILWTDLDLRCLPELNSSMVTVTTKTNSVHQGGILPDTPMSQPYRHTTLRISWTAFEGRLKILA